MVLPSLWGLNLTGVAREWRKDKHRCTEKLLVPWTGLSSPETHYMQVTRKAWLMGYSGVKETDLAHTDRNSLYRGTVQAVNTRGNSYGVHFLGTKPQIPGEGFAIFEPHLDWETALRFFHGTTPGALDITMSAAHTFRAPSTPFKGGAFSRFHSSFLLEYNNEFLISFVLFWFVFFFFS